MGSFTQFQVCHWRTVGGKVPLKKVFLAYIPVVVAKKFVLGVFLLLLVALMCYIVRKEMKRIARISRYCTTRKIVILTTN